MPNWCSTNLTVYSKNQPLIKDLKSRLDYYVQIPATAEEFGNTEWLKNLLLHAGFTKDDIYDGICGSTRGYVTGCSDVEADNGNYYFEISTEDAWSCNIEAWRNFVNKLYPDNDIRFAWAAVEPGMGLYLKYDPDNLFYENCEYCVDSYADKDDAYMQFEELEHGCGDFKAEDLIEIFDAETMEEVMAKADKLNEKLENEYGGHFYINKYETMKEES